MNTWVPPLPTNSNPGPKSGLAVTSLVLGIISILTCGLGFLVAIPAIITGHIAYGRARRAPAQFGGGGLAIAGFVTGYVSLGLTMLMLPALSAAKAQAPRIQCANNLRSINVGARLWAADHNNGRLPADFTSFKAELTTPKILVCPIDKSRKPALDWAQLGPANITYEIVSPGTTDSAPSKVFVRCPIHGTEAYVDGSVQMKAQERQRR